MTPLVATYASYVLISVGLTVWVGRTLSSNGRVFLVDVFRHDDLTSSVNHLLLVGFYLLNLGFVCLFLRLGYAVTDASGAIEALSRKVGMVLLVLGAAHFMNLYVFSRIRRRGPRGEVWRGAEAWLMCMWATYAWRGLALELATPTRMRRARQLIETQSAQRQRISAAFRLRGEECETCGA